MSRHWLIYLDIFNNDGAAKLKTRFTSGSGLLILGKGQKI